VAWVFDTFTKNFSETCGSIPTHTSPTLILLKRLYLQLNATKVDHANFLLVGPCTCIILLDFTRKAIGVLPGAKSNK